MRILHGFMIILSSLLMITPASGETVYGEEIADFQKVKISELMAKPDDYLGKKVQVEGLILDVCPRRGCWIEIASDQEFQSLRFKVKDGVIVFPMEEKGKHVVAGGIFRGYEPSKEDVIAQKKHFAEEKGEPFDLSTVTGPEMYYQLQGVGALVK